VPSVMDVSYEFDDAFQRGPCKCLSNVTRISVPLQCLLEDVSRKGYFGNEIN
jgi:hypothetical protein